jgi:hypothetical protein
VFEIVIRITRSLLGPVPPRYRPLSFLAMEEADHPSMDLEAVFS